MDLITYILKPQDRVEYYNDLAQGTRGKEQSEGEYK